MKESQLRQIIREELISMNEGRAEYIQLDNVEDGHDWQFKMAIQVKNSIGKSTKWLALSEKEFNELRDIF